MMVRGHEGSRAIRIEVLYLGIDQNRNLSFACGRENFTKNGWRNSSFVVIRNHKHIRIGEATVDGIDNIIGDLAAYRIATFPIGANNQLVMRDDSRLDRGRP